MEDIIHHSVKRRDGEQVSWRIAKRLKIMAIIHQGEGSLTNGGGDASVQGANGFAGGGNPKPISKGKGLFDPRVKGWASLTLVQLWRLMGI